MGPPEIPNWATTQSPKTKALSRTPVVGTRKTPIKSKAGAKCQVCGERFLRLSHHMSQTDGLTLMECPHCLADVAVKKGGKRRCSDCKKMFTVGASGGLLGIRAECPECYHDLYTEKLGPVRCPWCRGTVWIKAKGHTVLN